MVSYMWQSSICMCRRTLVEFERELPNQQQPSMLLDPGRRYLEEAKLVRGLVGPDDKGLHVPDVDVAAGDGKR